MSNIGTMQFIRRLSRSESGTATVESALLKSQEPQREASMGETDVKRKLTVILAADVEGYSRLMGADEEATLKTLRAYREIIYGLIARHDGRVFGTAGDSVVAEFASPVEAVRSAISIQEELRVRNAELPDDRKMHFRIGINLDDVMVEGDNLYGDGVNVAARLEGLAEPGGIYVSGNVFNQVKHKLSAGFEDIGPQEVSNIAEPVPVFRLVPGPVSVADTAKAAPKPSVAARWRLPVTAAAVIVVATLGGEAIWETYLRPPAGPSAKLSIAILPFTNMSADPEQAYFSNGTTEDLITDLGKIPGLSVLSRDAVFRYKGKDLKPGQLGREFGMRYVLEGSVREASDMARITAQLIKTDDHLWAKRYDRNYKDIFAVQDEIVQKIVAALEVKITEARQARLARRLTNNP